MVLGAMRCGRTGSPSRSAFATRSGVIDGGLVDQVEVAEPRRALDSANDSTKK